MPIMLFRQLWPVTASEIHEGTAQAGGDNTITLDGGAGGENDEYNNKYINLTGGMVWSDKKNCEL